MGKHLVYSEAWCKGSLASNELSLYLGSNLTATAYLLPDSTLIVQSC